MKRGSFIKKVGLGAAAAGAVLSAPAVHAQKRFRWRVVTTWSPAPLVEGVDPSAVARRNLTAFRFPRKSVAIESETASNRNLGENGGGHLNLKGSPRPQATTV